MVLRSEDQGGSKNPPSRLKNKRGENKRPSEAQKRVQIRSSVGPGEIKPAANAAFFFRNGWRWSKRAGMVPEVKQSPEKSMKHNSFLSSSIQVRIQVGRGGYPYVSGKSRPKTTRKTARIFPKAQSRSPLKRKIDSLLKRRKNRRA